MHLTKANSILFMLGVALLSMVFVPRLPAETTPGQGGLSDAQKSLLSAGLTEKKSSTELIKLAMAEGMGCEEVVAFLLGKSGNDQRAHYELVYAAITAGCDAEMAVSGALRAGGNLQTVVRAARAAGASREAISAAATKNGYTPVQISNAFAGTGSGAVGGGPFGDGPLSDGASGGAVIGGGAGGLVPASPHKP